MYDWTLLLSGKAVVSDCTGSSCFAVHSFVACALTCLEKLASALFSVVQFFNDGLLLQVSDQIWVCDKKKVTPWKGDIRDYKKLLAKNMGL